MTRTYPWIELAVVLMILGIVPWSIKVLGFVAAFEIIVNVCKTIMDIMVERKCKKLNKYGIQMQDN